MVMALRASIERQPVPTRHATRPSLESFMPLVHSIANLVAREYPYYRSRLSLEDLEQSGCVGALDALQRYDISRGVAPVTFLYPRIRGAMLDELRSVGLLTRRRAANHFPLDDPKIKSTVDQIAAPEITIKEPGLERALTHLTGQRERRLIELCYIEEMTLEEAGEQLGLSKSGASRAHQRVLRLLRSLLEVATEKNRTSKTRAVVLEPVSRAETTIPDMSPESIERKEEKRETQVGIRTVKPPMQTTIMKKSEIRKRYGISASKIDSVLERFTIECVSRGLYLLTPEIDDALRAGLRPPDLIFR